MILVQMNKIDLGTFGEAYVLTFGNVEEPNKKEVKVTISEHEAELMKPLFSHSKKSGKFNEHEEWT